jgi:RNA polymerase sporulation-specific sigma factor
MVKNGMQNLYFQKEEYNNLDDNEVITKIKQGDKKALNYLLDKYTDVVSMKAGKYFIVGAEKEDIIQEGLIGLFKAIKSFNPEKQSSFKTFANLCIERQLQTAIKSSMRQKHMPLNSYLSLNISAYDESEDTSLLEVFETENAAEDPLDIVTKKEYYNFVEDRIEETLSDFEKQVLHRYTNGESYTQIAERLNAPVKSVDNAIQRIRKKTVKNILNYEE